MQNYGRPHFDGFVDFHKYAPFSTKVCEANGEAFSQHWYIPIFHKFVQGTQGRWGAARGIFLSKMWKKKGEGISMQKCGRLDTDIQK
jgi:hypothetical protein